MEQSFINSSQKQKHKNQQPTKTEQIYLCECGRKYLTFPALYLHAKLKHGVKFTTKMSPQVCQTLTINNQIYIRYFIQKKNFKTVKKNYEISYQLCYKYMKSKDAITIFAENLKFTEQKEKQQVTLCFSELQDYLRKIQQFPAALPTLHSFYACNLPLYFNDFVLYHLGGIHGGQKHLHYLCKVLFKFGEWLKEQQLTPYTLQYQQNWMNIPIS